MKRVKKNLREHPQEEIKPAEWEGPFCSDHSQEGVDYWICTRPKGHFGVHAAHISLSPGTPVCATWEDEWQEELPQSEGQGFDTH